MYLFDRRNSDRFFIAGARVHFKTRKGELVLSPLADLTRSSARFVITEELIISDKIEIGIDVPGHHLVRIKGTVVWTSSPLIENPAFAVVQFLPFGTDSRYNSMRTHEHVKAIIEKHSDRIDTGTPL